MTEDGKLNRKRVEDRLMTLIQKDTAQNVVLAGPWGSGKTTLLEEVVERLKNADTATRFYVVSFSVWAVGTGEDPTVVLVRQLIGEFNKIAAKSLGKMTLAQKKALKDALGELAEDLARAPGTRLVGALAKFALSLVNTRKTCSEAEALREGFRSIVQGILDARKNRRLLLIIDDLDRVTPEEGIRFLDSMFHMFLESPGKRRVAAECTELPGWPISSVWAVNMTVLEEALYQRYRLQPSFDATAYLAKIFHCRIDVPPVFATRSHRGGSSSAEKRLPDDDQGSAVLWEHSLRELLNEQDTNGTSLSWRLALQLGESLNYNQLGNLRMHRMVRDSCIEYWRADDDHAARLAKLDVAVRDARLLVLTHAFPGFRETVAIYKRWNDFVRRVNQRTRQPSFEPAQAFQWKFADDPGLWAVLTDLEALEWREVSPSSREWQGPCRAVVGRHANQVSDDLARMLLRAF